MIQRVEFFPKHVAENMLPRDNTALISIVEPNETRNFVHHWQHRLDLDFHDVDAIANGGRTWSVLGATIFTTFDENHAANVVNFLHGLPDTIDHIIVHCHAGISRSAAVAKFVAEKYNVQNFNHGYNMYNRKVYSTLRDFYYGIFYENS